MNYNFGDEKVKVITPNMAGGFLRAVGMFALAIIIVILLFASIAKVPTGHVGVLTLFGRVTGDVLPEGIHLVNPFKTNNVLSVQTQTMKETATVPSNEGLIMTLDTSLLFRLDPSRAAEVYQKVGPMYIERVVEPNLRSVVRAVTSML